MEVRACEYSYINTCRQVFKSFSCHEKTSCYRICQTQLPAPLNSTKLFKNTDNKKNKNDYFQASQTFNFADFQ